MSKRVKTRDIYTAAGIAALAWSVAMMAGCVSTDAAYIRGQMVQELSTIAKENTSILAEELRGERNRRYDAEEAAIWQDYRNDIAKAKSLGTQSDAVEAALIAETRRKEALAKLADLAGREIGAINDAVGGAHVAVDGLKKANELADDELSLVEYAQQKSANAVVDVSLDVWQKYEARQAEKEEERRRDREQKEREARQRQEIENELRNQMTEEGATEE